MFCSLILIAVMKYQVIVYTGDVHSAGTDANVYVCLVGSKGTTGRRQLKYSLTNNSKFEQDQVRIVLSLSMCDWSVVKEARGADSSSIPLQTTVSLNRIRYK